MCMWESRGCFCVGIFLFGWYVFLVCVLLVWFGLVGLFFIPSLSLIEISTDHTIQ